jgi:hypothetical protein
MFVFMKEQFYRFLMYGRKCWTEKTNLKKRLPGGSLNKINKTHVFYSYFVVYPPGKQFFKFFFLV